jgi:hypothetical protein
MNRHGQVHDSSTLNLTILRKRHRVRLFALYAEGISSRSVMAYFEVSLREQSKVEGKAINARESENVLNVVDLYFQ